MLYRMPSFLSRLPGTMYRYASFNWTVFDQALVSGVNFLTGVLLARFLGMAEFGWFSIIWMVILFINSFQTAMIISPMMSIGPKQAPHEESVYYGAVLLQQIGFTMLSSLVLVFAAVASSVLYPAWRLEAFLWPVLAVTISAQLQEYIRRYFFTRLQSRLAFINDAISYLGQLIILILCYQAGYFSIDIVLWITALTSMIAVCSALPQLKWQACSRQHLIQIIGRHLQFSKWLLASNIMTWLSGNYLLASAGALLGVTAVGILKACQNIVGIIHILFYALGNIVPVRTGRILSDSTLSAMERYLGRALGVGGLLTLLLALPALLIPGTVLRCLYGATFQPWGGILFLYGWVYLIMFMNQIITFALRTLEETRPIFMGYLLTALCSIALAPWLISTFGLYGVLGGMLLLALLNLTVLGISYWLKRREVSCTSTF